MVIKQVLESLGWSEKEVAVYVALLERDGATAAELSKKTGINRTSCYDLLDFLMKRGLISKYKKKGKTTFSTVDPRRLVSYLDREKEESAKKIEAQKKLVQDALPELVSLFNPPGTRPRVQFFEGEKGMREAYEDTLSSRETILAYANIETMYEGLPHFFPGYFTRRAAAKIKIKAIFPDNAPSRERAAHNTEDLRETRFLPRSDLTFTPEINIYGNKMLIASWREKIAIIIESKELAELQKISFNLLWKSLQK